MHQEELGFAHLRASTGGLQEGDVVGGMSVGAVEVGASTKGALFGIASLVTVLVGATWIRRRTVNTYVGASRSFAEEDDDRAKMLAKFWPGRQGVPRAGAPEWIQDEFLRMRVEAKLAGEPRERSRVIYEAEGRPNPLADRPMRRGVVEMTPAAPPQKRAAAPMDEDQLFDRAASIAEGKGLIAPWVENRGNHVVVVGVDPLPRFEKQERRGPGGQVYEASAGVAGAYKIRTFKIPLINGRLGVASPISDATKSERGIYRTNVPPEAFGVPTAASTKFQPYKGGGYPWDSPSFTPKDFNQIRAEYRSFVRRVRAAERAQKGT